jgi:exonuclease SbcD
MSLRLLHTSDVHLGATFKMLGERGREQRRQLQETFARVMDLAIGECVDAVMIAGDLFDSATAARAHLPFAAEQLGRLGEAGIPACVIAGNHDPWDAGGGSLWRDLGARCPQLAILGPRPEVRVFAERDLTICGRSITGGGPPGRPLAGLPVARQTRHLVAVAHGSVERSDIPARADLITPAEIAASGVDYLALGDWHSSRDVSSGGIAAWYSGAPEMIDVDEPGSGCVCLVTVESSGYAQVERRRVGRRRALSLTLDLATVGGAAGVTREITARADQDTALMVTLTGLVGPEDRVSVDSLLESLAPEFFRLEIRDESHLRGAGVDPSRCPDGTVIGRFARRMAEEIATREGASREIAEEALAYGMALLEGREVLS